MISFLRRTTLLTLLIASPASALPLVSVNGGADMTFFTQRPAGMDILGMGANARVSALGLDLSAEGVKFSDRNYVEARFNTNLSPIPMLSLKPGIGIANTDYLKPGTTEWAPVVGVRGEFSPILMPVSVDAEASIAYPITTRQSIVRLDAGVNLSLLPFTSVRAGLKSFQTGSEQAFGPSIGLRVGL